MLVIVGFPKCGTISLHKHLIEHFGDDGVKRDECIFQENAVDGFIRRWGDMATPVIAFRDLPERCYSWYYHIKPNKSYAKFLRTEYSNNGFGEMNPIKQCNVKKWVTPWLKLNPLFYSFEAMTKQRGFPHINISKDKLKMTPAHRDLTLKLLREELIK